MKQEVDELDTITLSLSSREVNLLLDALDSHEYWQLSDENYRNSGCVVDPGSDDEDAVSQIQDCRRLAEILLGRLR